MALSHNAVTPPLLRMLNFAQRYTQAIDWHTLDVARATPEQTGAIAEGDLARLRLPDGASM